MTNMELITQNATTMEDFISAVVCDALAADGCSYDLKLPQALQEPEFGDEALDWKTWLGREAQWDCIVFPDGTRIDQWQTRR